MLSVYNASAGSGKTFTLAARYISLLLRGVPHKSILAVTFTNKATAEMKERIMSELNLLAMGTGDDDFRNKVLEFIPAHERMSENEMKERCRMQLRLILDDYDHFTVSTIDSFLQMLLGEVARVAGLQANYKVELRDSDVIDFAVDKMISNLNELDEATRRRLRELIMAEMEDNRKWDGVGKKLKNLASELKTEAYLRGKEKLQEYIEGDDSFNNYISNIRKLPGLQCIQEMKKLVEKYKDTFGIQWVIGNKQYDRWIKSFVNKQANETYELLNERAYDYLSSDDFYRTYEGPATAEELAGILMEMQRLVPKCREYSINYQMTTKRLGHLSVLSSISKMIDDINTEANRLMLSATPILLRRILKEGNDTMFVLEKAGTRFSHIMIDEFQDTSGMQWENFLPLLDEVLSRGGSVLLVGDIKQSIYRWRGGNWDILLGIEEDQQLKPYFDKGQGEMVSLDRNYRSKRNIVEFNLGFFQKAAKVLDSMHDSLAVSKASIPENGISKIYDEHFSSERIDEFVRSMDPQGYVSVKLYPYSNSKKETSLPTVKESEESILHDLFENIAKMISLGVGQHDMMILVRKKPEIDKIRTYYKSIEDKPEYKQIKLVSSDAYHLEYSLSVRLVVECLRYLQNNSNKSAQYYIAWHYQHDILGRQATWPALRLDVKSYLPAVLNDFSIRFLPLYEKVMRLVTSVLYREDGSRILHDDNYLTTFLDNLLDFISENGSDAEGFLKYWDETLCKSNIPAPSVVDGIQMMTIHKAKGLEAHTVFLPFCQWSIEGEHNNKGENYLWCSPKVEPYSALPILPIVPVKELSESIYCDDYAIEYYRRRIDNLNLLYVAFTRAKCNLFVMGIKKVSDKKNKEVGINAISDLVAEVLFPTGELEYEKGKPVSAKKKEEKKETANRLDIKPSDITLKITHFDARLNFQQSGASQRFVTPLTEEQLQQQEFIREGNLYHEIFSSISTVDDVEKAVSDLYDSGIIDTREKADQITAFIRRRWSNPKAASWFDGSWKLMQECSILVRENGKAAKYRPDRVMIKDDETVVIDFKLGKPKSEYTYQVARYMQLLKAMKYPNVKGYLWYLYSNQTKEITLPLL